MNIAYFGTPGFSATLLENIMSDPELDFLSIKGVITQPDQPVGRSKEMTSAPVKILATKHNLPIFTNLNSAIEMLKECEIGVVFAYGKILPTSILSRPTHGMWNIHLSVLPTYRGAAPVVFPVLLGDTTTGATLTQMDDRMDHGPLLLQSTHAITSTTTAPDLTNQLAQDGFALLKAALIQLRTTGTTPTSTPQDHTQATFTQLLTKEDGFVPYEMLKAIITGRLVAHGLPPIYKRWHTQNPAVLITIPDSSRQLLWNMFRALHPWPGLWTTLPNKRRLKITGMDYTEAIPEDDLAADHSATPDLSPITITHVQLEGKNPVTLDTFLLAYPDAF